MSGQVAISCASCGAISAKLIGAVNRARKNEAPLYCDRECASVARRKGKSDSEKKEAKRLYDAEYRNNNLTRIKAKRAAYFQATYDPAQAAEHRKSRMAYHVEYCRRPDVRHKKAACDRVYLAKKAVGDFWETALLLRDVEKEITARMSRYEIDLINGKLNKRTNRKREYDRTHSNRT